MRPTLIGCAVGGSLMLAGAILPAGEAGAAATAWVGTERAAVRLVTATDGAGQSSTVSAGLEFRYGDGWHGYWRTPGDAGIAPQFGWAGSENVAGSAVAWPAPHRLDISGLQNAVYTGRFILPVTVTLAAPGAATRLVLALDYAACANICVPIHADLSLPLPPGGARSAEAGALAAALAMVPGTPAAAAFDIRQQTVTPDGTGRRLTLILRSRGAPFHHPDLFVELPDGGLPPAPTVTLDDDGRTATLTAALPDASTTVPTLTVVDGERAAEIPAGVGEPVGDVGSHELPAILAIALLGGLILNVMPCVLPILSLKLSGVARHAG